MERINFPQITGQSDLVDPFSPGRFQFNFFDTWDELEKEYDMRV